MPITCFIRYPIDPFRVDAFEQYARNWDQATARCGADPVGYVAPGEGPATAAHGIHDVGGLAACEAYRARLEAEPLGRKDCTFERRKHFILREERLYLRPASTPRAQRVTS